MLEALGIITNIEDFSDTFLIFISNLIVGVRGHTMYNFHYFKVNETCFTISMWWSMQINVPHALEKNINSALHE